MGRVLGDYSNGFHAEEGSRKRALFLYGKPLSIFFDLDLRVNVMRAG
jgi:hypothetical protein